MGNLLLQKHSTILID